MEFDRLPSEEQGSCGLTVGGAPGRDQRYLQFLAVIVVHEQENVETSGCET